jgi:hypothetical protein
VDFPVSPEKMVEVPDRATAEANPTREIDLSFSLGIYPPVDCYPPDVPL